MNLKGKRVRRSGYWVFLQCCAQRFNMICIQKIIIVEEHAESASRRSKADISSAGAPDLLALDKTDIDPGCLLGNAFNHCTAYIPWAILNDEPLNVAIGLVGNATSAITKKRLTPRSVVSSCDDGYSLIRLHQTELAFSTISAQFEVKATKRKVRIEGATTAHEIY